MTTNETPSVTTVKKKKFTKLRSHLPRAKKIATTTAAVGAIAGTTYVAAAFGARRGVDGAQVVFADLNGLAERLKEKMQSDEKE